MASVEAKLAESLTQTANLREALQKEVEERRRDHDLIIGMERDLKTAFNRIEKAEDRSKEQDEERAQLFKELEEKTSKKDEAAEKKRVEEKKDRIDEKTVRIGIWIPVVAAVFGSIIGAVATVWLTVKFIGH